MTHRAWWPLIAAGSLALVGVGALLLRGRPAEALNQPSTIRITDRELSYRRYDEGPRGKGAGDIEIAWQSLHNYRITKKAIGHAETLCTILTKRSSTCTSTYFLPKGKLVVEGTIGSPLLYELPVVGGTGLYEGARGSLVVTRSGEKPPREILVFRLEP